MDLILHGFTSITFTLLVLVAMVKLAALLTAPHSIPHYTFDSTTDAINGAISVRSCKEISGNMNIMLLL
jgi:hypothetical protein